jgi:hypothetical protein
MEALFIPSPGYVLDFSDATFAEFFRSELGVDINDQKYCNGGASKAKRLRSFLTTEPDALVMRALVVLMNYAEKIRTGRWPPIEPEAHQALLACHQAINRLSKPTSLPTAEALENFAQTSTVDQLIEAIKHDNEVGKPELALDRVHTYCMKRFAHLLASIGKDPAGYSTLDGRAGAYVNNLRAKGLPSTTDFILKSTTKLMQELNEVRNKQSLAHDNALLAPDEARFSLTP